MAENAQLTAFLADAAPTAEPAPAAPEPAAPEPAAPSGTPPAAATPKPEAKPEAKPAAEPKADTAKPEADDSEPPQPLDGEAVIGRRAYEDERRKRQDWKEKAARFEGELAALRRQLEEKERAAAQPPQPPPQPPPPLPPIDLVNDPQGFVQRVHQALVQERTQLEHKILNDRLNTSEERLRDKIGDDKVDQYVADFQEFAKSDQSLYDKLYAQRNPYAWMEKEVHRQRLHRDVGADPEAFKAKLRAEWEAERAAADVGNGGAGPPGRAMPQLQPSLATARSVAGRSTSTWTGEPSLDDVLAPIQNRKRANGDGRGPVRF